MSFDWGGFSGAVITVVGTFLIARISFKWGVKNEQERNEQIKIAELEDKARYSRRVANIVESRMELVYGAIQELCNEAKINMLREVSLSKGLPDDVIVQALDLDLVTKIYEVWLYAELIHKAANKIDAIGNIPTLRKEAYKFIEEFHSVLIELHDYAHNTPFQKKGIS